MWYIWCSLTIIWYCAIWHWVLIYLIPRLTGTCFSPPECQSKTGGFADGACATGFGTCCVILLSECGGSIGENSTHFSSPDYPKVYQTEATCTYTLNKIDTDICFLRLEFINFVLDGPVSSASFPNQNWDCINDNVRYIHATQKI